MDSPSHRDLNGKDFREIASLGTDEWDAFFEILHGAGDELEEIHMVGRLFTDDHLADMISHPLFCLGVDSYTSSTEGKLGEVSPHPMAYASHVRYLTHHVREMATLRLEEATRKMTSMTASHFGLHDRGVIREGAKADVVDFDFEDTGRLRQGIERARPCQWRSYREQW